MGRPAEIAAPARALEAAAPRETRRVLSQTAVYLAATIAAQGLNFVWVLTLARLLGPDRMGVWNAFAVVLAYAGVLELGVLNAVYREIPYARGQGHADDVSRLRALSLGMAELSAGTSAALVIGAGTWLAPGLRAEVAILGLVLAGREGYVLLSTWARSDRDFALAGQAAVLRVIVWCAGLAWVARSGLAGLLASVLAGDLAAGLLLARRRGHAMRPRIERGALLRLAGIGWPMLASSTLATLMSTVDRMIVIALLGRAALGHYSLAIIAMGLLMVAPPAADQVLCPAMSERLGATGRADSLRRYLEMPTLALAYATPLLMAMIALGLPLLSRCLLPAYRPGLGAAGIMIVGGFFLASGSIATKLLMVINRQRAQLAAQCGAVAVQAALAWALSRFGLEGIAAASAAAYGLYAAAVLGLCLKFLGYRPGEAARLGGLIALPLAAYLAFAAIRPPLPHAGLWADLGHQAAVFGAFVVGYAAPLAGATGALPRLRATVRDLYAAVKPPGRRTNDG